MRGQLTAGHARALLGAADPVALARKIIAEGLRCARPKRWPRGSAKRRAAETPAEKDADTRALERDLARAAGARGRDRPWAGRGGALTVRYRAWSS